MNRYLVKVVKLKDQRTFLKTAEDGSFFSAEEGDTFGGYTYPRNLKEGRYLDLWLNDVDKPMTEDKRNIVTFGRIKSVSHYDFMRSNNVTVTTKLGTFIVIPVGVNNETMEDTNILQ